MNIIRKIAKPCGVVGGVWIILLSMLVFLVTPTHVEVASTSQDTTGQILRSSITETSFLSGSLPLLIIDGVMAVMGILALASLLALKNRPRLRQTLIWVSAVTALIISFIFGLVLLPAAILLIVAAIGMKETESTPFQEAV